VLLETKALVETDALVETRAAVALLGAEGVALFESIGMQFDDTPKLTSTFFPDTDNLDKRTQQLELTT